MTREEVQDLSIVLKGGGLTVREVLRELTRLGYVNEKTGKPYSFSMVNGWCRGVSSQRGFRKPCLVGLSEEERLLHDAEMRERQLSRMRKWRESHREYLREYMREYYRL